MWLGKEMERGGRSEKKRERCTIYQNRILIKKFEYISSLPFVLNGPHKAKDGAFKISPDLIWQGRFNTTVSYHF